MKIGASICFFLLFATGCITKSAADKRAHDAFLAGQQQTIQIQAAPTGDNIQVMGNVKNSTVEWVDGMSLSQAIVAAEYQDDRDPIEILIFRRGQVINVNPKDLLRGRDHLLEPGDRIQLRR
jgi:hypothetical protein